MNKQLKYTIGALAALCVAAGCDDMNSLHQEYLDRGAKVYLGKPDSVLVEAGYNRLRIRWTNNADSKIDRTRIVYNYGNDTIDVPFYRTTPGFQRDSVTLDLEPGDYVFDLCNLSADGALQSIPVTGLIGKVYGDSYRMQLVTRSFETAVDRHTVTILWGDVTSDYLYSVVRYTDRSGAIPEEKTVVCGNNSYRTVLENIADGDVIRVSSAYKPEENYMDVLESNPTEVRFVEKHGEIDRTKCTRYTAIAFDNTTDHAGWSLFPMLFDGKPAEAWLTSIPDENSQNGHRFPVSFTVDLNSTAEVDRLVMYMATGWEYINSSPKHFEVWGTDEIRSGMPDAYWATTEPGDWTSDWVKLGDCETLQPSGGGTASVTDADIAYAREGFAFPLNPDKRPVRYIRILIDETWDGTVNTGIGELTFYGNALMRDE